MINPLGYIILALVALSGWLGWQSHTRGVSNDAMIVTISERDGTIERMSGELIVAKQAKVGSDNAISDLRARLSAAVGQQQETERLAAVATSRAAKATRDATKARDQLNTEREQAYAMDQSAQAWRDSLVPDAIARSLRVEWHEARAIGLRDDDHADPGRNTPTPIRPVADRSDRNPRIASAAYDWTQSIAVASLTNGQLLDATSDALGGYRAAAGRLGEIGRLQALAIK